MFGVVLWSDRQRNRAVIWCEDHGDLAFFKGEGADGAENSDIEPGDLVQFDLRREKHMRLASNPRVVASEEYPTLARDLQQAGYGGPADFALPVTGQGKGADRKILAFEPKSVASIGPVPRRRRRRAV